MEKILFLRMNNSINFFGKNFKKTLYRVRTTDFKKIIRMMLIGGMLATLAYGARYQYIEYAVSKAYLSLVYPEIARGEYPDNSRFTYYDFISEQRVQETLDIMQKRGKYKNFTAKQLCEQFYVYSYLEESIKDDVSTIRLKGNNYTYVANEYKITFVQPHDHTSNNFIKRFFHPDYSDEFLTELMNVNNKYIDRKYGGATGFETLVNVGYMSNYDYSEKVSVYKTKISSILTHLNSLDNDAGGFVSAKTGKTFKDIKILYKVLFSERLDRISNFIESSGLTSDLEAMNNKLNINIEINGLKYNKLLDEVAINNYAKDSYDHIFTENLIVVSTKGDEGFYQTRPKTAFDIITAQYHRASNFAIERNTKLSELYSDQKVYSEVTNTTEEYNRLIQKCEELLSEFDEDYVELCDEACLTVSDYLSDKNKGFLTSKVMKKAKINKNFITKSLVSFILGMMIVFVLYTAHNTLDDFKKIKSKKRLLKEIRERE